MRTFKGIPVSPGVSIAPAAVLRPLDLVPERRAIAPSQTRAEIERFHEALRQARQELDQQAMRAGLTEAFGSIAIGHREILRDPTLLREVEEAIENGRSSADYAVAVVFRRWIVKFKALEDEFFRQRYVDLVDLERRVLAQLRPEEASEPPTPEHPAILIAQDLTPSEAVTLDRKSYVGFATEFGGSTSHTAIIAKSIGIPAVCGVGHVTDAIRPGQMVICDGEEGLVILDPDEETLRRYQELRGRLKRRFRLLKRMSELPAQTLDGWPVGVSANIEFPSEVDQALRNGADGIGLYRTEFLYADRQALPDEEAHLEAYREALERLKGRPLTIRTFDFGADKYANEVGMAREPNPFLGCRSIRYSFARPELFRTQLRAILRASVEGRVRLMFPMISSVSEIRQARAVLEEVKEELWREGLPFRSDLKVGAMIEIPSAAVGSDLLAREVDFFSIGTNDLTQYTLAVDRTNERVATLFRPSNPSILRLLRQVGEVGERHGIRVTVCGEMASERAYTLLLVGLGIRHFSVAPGAVPAVKQLVRSVTRRHAAQVIERIHQCSTPEEVDEHLKREAERLVPETFPA
jgi:phosphotransferase system enzyme I (PtsI)